MLYIYINMPFITQKLIDAVNKNTNKKINKKKNIN